MILSLINFSKVIINRFILPWRLCHVFQLKDVSSPTTLYEQVILNDKSSQSDNWFISSEFTWLWLVAGNWDFQCNSFGKVNVFDEFGGLTLRSWHGGNCIKCLKSGWNRKMGWGNKTLKMEGMLHLRDGALKRGLWIL